VVKLRDRLVHLACLAAERTTQHNLRCLSSYGATHLQYLLQSGHSAPATPRNTVGALWWLANERSNLATLRGSYPLFLMQTFRKFITPPEGSSFSKAFDDNYQRAQRIRRIAEKHLLAY